MFKIKKERGVEEGTVCRLLSYTKNEEDSSIWGSQAFSDVKNFSDFIVIKKIGTLVYLVPLRSYGYSIYQMTRIARRRRRHPFLVQIDNVTKLDDNIHKYLDTEYGNKYALRSVIEKLDLTYGLKNELWNTFSGE